MVAQLLLQLQKPTADLTTDAAAFGDGGKIPLVIGLVDLTTRQRQQAVSAVTITDHRTGKALTQQRLGHAAQRLGASWNIATVGVGTTHSQPSLPSGFLPSALPIGPPVSSL